MDSLFNDEIGNSPISTLPLGVATLGTDSIGWIGYLDSGSGDLQVEGGDAWALDLTAGKEYKLVFEVTDGPSVFGDYDRIMVLIGVADPTALSKEKAAFNAGATDTDDNLHEFTFTAPETNTYYFHVQAYFSGAPKTSPYRFVVTEVGPGGPDPDDLPDLVAPDPDSLETALYSGFRADSRAITYWFAPNGEDDSDGWDAVEKDAAKTAMKKWAAVADINFAQADTKADATWLLVAKNDYEHLGSFDFPQGGQQTGTFDKTDETWAHTGGKTGLIAGGNGFLTLLHEFGHALGLAHPHDEGGVSTKLPGVAAPFGDLGDNDLNQTPYTVMSYNTGFNHPKAGSPDAVNWGHAIGPSAIDIAVAQRLYGTVKAKEGNTIYNLVGTNDTGTGFLTIWDTGGTDTIRGAGDKRAFIDLRAATLMQEKGGGGWASFKEGISGGFTIANSVVIENAQGGSKRDVLIGNEFDNKLLGKAGKDVLKGNGGNDILLGGDQKDLLIGGKGDDTLNGGKGQDIADYRKASAAITVDMATGTVTGVDTGTDTLISVERVIGSRFDDTMTGGSNRDRLEGGKGRDKLDGNGNRDTLIGNEGRDILLGKQGNDILIGGAGRDGMRGGKGDDTFVYLDLSDSGATRKGFDLIKGFQTGDIIDLSRLDAIAGGSDDAFTFRGNKGFTGAGGEIKIVVKGSKTFVLADIDGDKKFDFGIELLDAIIDAGDFIL